MLEQIQGLRQWGSQICPFVNYSPIAQYLTPGSRLLYNLYHKNNNKLQWAAMFYAVRKLWRMGRACGGGNVGVGGGAHFATFR